MREFIAESFAHPAYYRNGMGQLDPSSGPEEVQFVGQSPASDLSSPIGASFIQGTGEQASSDDGTVLGIAALLLVGYALYSSRRKRWK